MTTNAIPDRTTVQRLEALDKGNGRRTMRAQRKKLWKRDGREEAAADLCDILESPPEWAETWKLWDALLALPKMGRVRAFDLFREVGLSHVKTLGGLTPRQRSEVIECLRSWSGYGHPEGGGKSASLRICPECGGRKGRHSLRCYSCRIKNAAARREAREAEARVCPDCGGAKSRWGTRCAKCHGITRRTTGWCACGRPKAKDARECWQCRYGHPRPDRVG